MAPFHRQPGALLSALALALGSFMLSASPAVAVIVQFNHVAGAGWVDPTAVEPSANLARPDGIAMDSHVFTYVSDSDENIVYRMDPWAIAAVYAGDGVPGFKGDGGTLDTSRLNHPRGLAVDPSGNLYIADTGNRRIRVVDPAGNGIATVAGSDPPGLTGVGGPAASASFAEPVAVASDAQGNIAIADASANRILLLGTDGMLRPLAGGGSVTPGSPGATASTLKLDRPDALVFGPDGTLYIAEENALRIDSLSPTGAVSVIADASGKNGFALVHPRGLALDPGSGDLYITDGNRVLVYTGGKVSPYAGTGEVGFIDGDQPALQSPLDAPTGVAWDVFSNRLEITDTGNSFLRIVLGGGVLRTFTRRGYGLNRDALSAKIVWPEAVAYDSQGRLLFTNPGHRLVWRMENHPNEDPSLVVVAVMGDGSLTPKDGAMATATGLLYPDGLTTAPDGSFYVSDRDNHVVVHVGSDGTVAVAAGTGSAGYSGDGGPGRAAQLRSPSGLALDGAGDLYIADTGNNRVRRLGADGTITTLAGNGIAGAQGDGGLSSRGSLDGPAALALDSTGRLYIADAGNNRIRRVDSNGLLSTVVGTGDSGFSGDGGPAVAAQLARPRGVWVDGAGSIFVSDTDNERIRKVDASGQIQSIAGTGQPGYDELDYGPLNTRMNHPAGLVGSPDGDLVFADRDDQVIQSLTQTVVPLGAVPAGPKAQSAAPPAPILGDTDGNGSVNIQDVILALQMAVGVQPVTPQALAADDFDHNGRITVTEVVRILRSTVGLGALHP